MAVGTILISSCTKSYVEYEYVLTCSKELLQYATPQVTYRDNNGHFQTFLLSEADMFDTKNSVTIVINGKTMTDDSLKTWRKGVKYENFGIVDDEMTVTYIPKSDIPEDATTEGRDLEHRLEVAYFEMKDDDGHYSTHHFSSTTINVGAGTTHKNLITAIKGFKDYKGIHIESSGKIEEKTQAK